jgi:hypothetical protein
MTTTIIERGTTRTWKIAKIEKNVYVPPGFTIVHASNKVNIANGCIDGVRQLPYFCPTVRGNIVVGNVGGFAKFIGRTAGDNVPARRYGIGRGRGVAPGKGHTGAWPPRFIDRVPFVVNVEIAREFILTNLTTDKKVSYLPQRVRGGGVADMIAEKGNIGQFPPHSRGKLVHPGLTIISRLRFAQLGPFGSRGIYQSVPIRVVHHPTTRTR